MKNLIVFMTVLMLAAPVHAAETQAEKIKRLELFLELNEASFVYLKHCADFDKELQAKPFFVENAKTTLITLANEMMAADPSLTEEKVKEVIYKKQEGFVNMFSADYKDPSDCTKAEALMGKRHFETFSQSPPGVFKRFLETNGELQPIEPQPEAKP
jgi:hypothetical protein